MLFRSKSSSASTTSTSRNSKLCPACSKLRWKKIVAGEGRSENFGSSVFGGTALARARSDLRIARPHPGPLPQEREKRRRVFAWLERPCLRAADCDPERDGESTQIVEIFQARVLGLPLPGGEGGGEGECCSNYSLRRVANLFHRKLCRTKIFHDHSHVSSGATARAGR